MLRRPTADNDQHCPRNGYGSRRWRCRPGAAADDEADEHRRDVHMCRTRRRPQASECRSERSGAGPEARGPAAAVLAKRLVERWAEQRPAGEWPVAGGRPPADREPWRPPVARARAPCAHRPPLRRPARLSPTIQPKPAWGARSGIGHRRRRWGLGGLDHPLRDPVDLALHEIEATQNLLKLAAERRAGAGIIGG